MHYYMSQCNITYLTEPSLNDLAVDGTLNTTNQPTYLTALKLLQRFDSKLMFLG